MPLFDISGASPKPFRRLNSAAEIYEAEIETLFWSDLESFTGEPLFAIARQAKISGGGVPDIVALDGTGRVVVIEIKRDVDRNQLSQCLEYAGWARQASLDDLAGLYHGGPANFFADWQEFTDTDSPRILNRLPRLILVARSFDGRTESALNYLSDNGVPVKLISVLFYEDSSGARILDVNNGADLAAAAVSPGVTEIKPSTTPQPSGATKAFFGVSLTDLLDAGLIAPNEPIEWVRPQVGQHHHAIITSEGLVETAGGDSFASLSMAADSLTGGSHNGWDVWKVPRLGGIRMTDVRQKFGANQP